MESSPSGGPGEPTTGRGRGSDRRGLLRLVKPAMTAIVVLGLALLAAGWDSTDPYAKVAEAVAITVAMLAALYAGSSGDCCFGRRCSCKDPNAAGAAGSPGGDE